MMSFFCCKQTNDKQRDSNKRRSSKVPARNSQRVQSISLNLPKKQPDNVQHFEQKVKDVIVTNPPKVQIKDIYEGEEFQGKPHGNGTKNYINGDYYRGQWVNGLKQGRGIHSYFQLQTRYEGQWKKNLKNGHGKYVEENGSYFQGEFKDGFKNGKGTYFDNDGQKFYQQIYDNGRLLERKQEKRENENISEEFPTLVLDKQRFNTQDLVEFEKANPEIHELELTFLLKYYGLCKVINLEFIETPMSDWTIKQVHQFLDQINLSTYKEIFYDNKIKGKDLLSLEESEMKTDLNMKLGDRKKLLNYIQYISSLVDKKQKNKKKVMKKRVSFGNVKNKKMMKMGSIGQQIIEQDEQYLNDSPTSSGKNKFITEEWDQFNSNAMEMYHSLNKLPWNHNKDQRVSHQSVRKSDETPDSELPPLKRKRSEEKDLMNSLGHSTVNNRKDKSPSPSGSSTSSDQSLEEDLKHLKRKKTSQNSQEIRQLYEFLRENQNLDFIIKPKDIEIIEQIGEGGYGKVYRGKYISCPVAVKDYIKAGKHNKSLEDFMKEVQIFSDLKHPNIVLYMGMCISVNQYQLVTEYMDNGSLYDHLHNKTTKFTPEQQLEIIDDIVRGMVYLHNMKNMLHRDLKSSNVLIAEDWKVKLCDFGLSGHKKKSKKKKKNRIGTYQWMAPEVIRNQEMDFFSDIYSFGVIIWEILTEIVPYDGLSEQQMIGLIGFDDNHKLDDPPKESSQFIVNIMKQCLNRNPSERPTFIQIQKNIDQYRREHPLTKPLWQNK